MVFETTLAFSKEWHHIASIIENQNRTIDFWTDSIVRSGNVATLTYPLFIDHPWTNSDDEVLRVWLEKYDTIYNYSADYTCFKTPVKISSLAPIRILFQQCSNATNQVVFVGIDPCVDQPCALRKGSLVEMIVRYNTIEAVSGAYYVVNLTYQKQNITTSYTTSQLDRYINQGTMTHMFHVPGSLTSMEDELLYVSFRVDANGTKFDNTCVKVAVKIVS